MYICAFDYVGRKRTENAYDFRFFFLFDKVNDSLSIFVELS